MARPRIHVALPAGKGRFVGYSRRDILRIGTGAISLGVVGRPQSSEASSYAHRAPAASYPGDLATGWYDLILDLIRETGGFTPPVASRALGYIGTTLYESVVAGIPGSQSLAGRVIGLTPPRGFGHSWVHWPSVANEALATIVRLLFPTASEHNQGRVSTLRETFARQFANSYSRGRLSRSEGLGRRLAWHIFAWSESDGGRQGYLSNFPSDYQPPTGSGLWVPTPPGYQPALQPYWGQNRPFVLQQANQFDPGAPPDFSVDSTSAFYAEAVEVYEAINNLTLEQESIAQFWADDPGTTATPPGHSISILTQVLTARQSSLAEAAIAYAAAGIAISDAFISCWACKYRYNLIRPITYIQTHIDAGWGNPLPVTTPPFPEYTSGHSVQSGAFAQVAHALFGDVEITDHTHDRLGMDPRSFTTWDSLAEEAAISRLYGGIHFRSAIELGVTQGRQIGSAVLKLFGLESQTTRRTVRYSVVP